MATNSSGSFSLCRCQFSTLPSELPSLIGLTRTNVYSNLLRRSSFTFACNTNARRLYLRITKVLCSFAISTCTTLSFLVYWFWSSRSIYNLAPSWKNWKLRNLLVLSPLLSRLLDAFDMLLDVQTIYHSSRTSTTTSSTPSTLTIAQKSCKGPV